MQVLLAPEIRLIDVQEIPESSTGACRAKTVESVLPPSVAVIVAFCVVPTDEAETVKFAEEAPAATVTDAGTLRAALLSARETTVPPEGAAWLRRTVQVDVPGALTEAGPQVNPVRVVVVTVATVIVPLVPAAVIPLPVAEAAPRFVSPIVLVVLVEDSVTFTTATTPLAILFEFSAVSRQV